MFVNRKSPRKTARQSSVRPERQAARQADESRRVPAQERSRQRVERILEAAALVFADDGFEAATMESIATRAATSIGSIYQFFPNKLAVFDALARRYRERTRAIVDALLAGPLLARPWPELIDAGVDALAAFHENEPGFRAVWVGVHLTDAVLVEGEAFNAELGRLLEGVIALKMPEMPARQRPIVATMLVEVMTAMLILAARRPDRAKAVMVETKSMLRRYLAGFEDAAARRAKGPTSARQGRPDKLPSRR